MLGNTARFHRVHILCKMGQREHTSQDYKDVVSRGDSLESNDMIRKAHFNLGHAYVWLKDYPRAGAQHEKTIGGGP